MPSDEITSRLVLVRKGFSLRAPMTAPSFDPFWNEQYAKGIFHGVPMISFLVLLYRNINKRRADLIFASWKLDVDPGTIYGLALLKDS